LNSSGKSYQKVHYEFRPAKQVERKMLLHAFNSLRDAGYQISRYEYTGLGSIYFIDFVLFHRYLGLTKMTSVEIESDIVKRVKFNCPYKQINLVYDDITTQIARLSRNHRHILWLDFDSILTEELVDAVQLAAAQLTVGSILLVTVDVEPPGRPEDGLKKYNPTVWMRHFETEARGLLWRGACRRDFAREVLPMTNAKILKTAIEEGLQTRDAKFIDMFSFLYADGHRMLSLGGMIGTDDDERHIKNLDRNELFFLKDDVTNDPFQIRVPLVTRKERLYLDQNMPCRKDWTPDEFEMKAEDIADYRAIYRYYPAYTEMLL
jgi:hypothetical protein